MIPKNRLNSVSTALGHLDRLRQNIRSTKPLPATPAKKDKINMSHKTNISMPDFNILMDSSCESLTIWGGYGIKVMSNVWPNSGRPQDSSSLLRCHRSIPVSIRRKVLIHVSGCFQKFWTCGTIRTGPAYVTAYRAAYVNVFKSKGHAFSIAKLDNESSILCTTSKMK